VRQPLLWATLLIALASAAVAVVIVGHVFPPPDATAAALGVAWLGGPYLLAAGLAVLLRRRAAVLVALLVTVALAGTVGAMFYDGVAGGVAEARRQAETAVLPGEDPPRAPAAMRKSGADLGQFFAEAFGVVVLAVVPPVQALAVALAGGVGYAVSVWRRGRADARRVWEAEHTDERGEYHPPG
jgi:hypothetical protein